MTSFDSPCIIIIYHRWQD